MSEDISADSGQPDPGVYPITLPRQYRTLWTPVATLLAMGAVTYLSLARGALGSAAVFAALALAGGLWAAVLISRRQTITADAVEANSLLGAMRILRKDISGYRRIYGGRYSAPARVLVAREGGQTIRLPETSGYATWVDALPDLDQTERQAAQAALEANPVFGATAEIRRGRIKAIRYAGLALMAVAGGLSLACLFWPAEPHALIFASAAAPLLAIAAVFALKRLRRETLGGQRIEIDTRWLILPSTCLLLAGIGLGIRVSQLQLVAKWSLVETGLLLALPVAAVAMWQDRKFLQSRPMWLPLVVVAGAAGWAGGTLGELNLAADHAPTRAFVTHITEKHIAHHRRSADSYHVTLAPWDGGDRAVGADVSSDLYASLQEGEQMCVTQHAGALGFAWFEDQPCPEAHGVQGVESAQPSAPPNLAVHSAT